MSAIYSSVRVSFQDEAVADDLYRFVEILGDSEQFNVSERLKIAAQAFARRLKRHFYKNLGDPIVERLERTVGGGVEFDLMLSSSTGCETLEALLHMIAGARPESGSATFHDSQVGMSGSYAYAKGRFDMTLDDDLDDDDCDVDSSDEEGDPD